MYIYIHIIYKGQVLCDYYTDEYYPNISGTELFCPRCMAVELKIVEAWIK